MINQITDTETLQNYVSPLLCSDLKYAGFNCKSTFFWKVYDDQVSLDTYIFDLDHYYRDGSLLLDKIAPPKEILPAYTIKEIEKHLPDFCVCRVNTSYELSIDEHYGVQSIKDERLPDLFALMMLACIRKRVINPNKIHAL